MKAFGLSVCIFLAASRAIAQEFPAVPETPARVADLVLAQPFTLAEGYRYDWSRDRPIVRSGTLVVLRVDPSLVVPRNSAEPILYVGDRTAQRLNHGHESGIVIAIVPGEINLTQAPIWFGTPGLPEQVGAETIRAERASADAAAIEPFTAAEIQDAMRDRVQAANVGALLRDQAANLVQQYSPRERELAEIWRSSTPSTRPPPAAAPRTQ